MNIKSKTTFYASIIIALIGGILILCDNFWWQTKKTIFISIGCSLIASGIVSILSQYLLENLYAKDIDEWKIVHIFECRSDKNKESDPQLTKIKERIDGIAFGLSKWRTNNETEILNALNRGVNIRLITMNPESSHVQERSIEENQNENLQQSINDLINFGIEMNQKSTKGKINIKGYNCMTLDFYWRMDDIVYTGPYLFHKDSSDTITYKFSKKGKGFDYYSKYFNELWNNPELINLV